MKIKIGNNKNKISWSTGDMEIASMGNDFIETDISEADFKKITEQGNKYEIDKKGKLKKKSKH